MFTSEKQLVDHFLVISHQFLSDLRMKPTGRFFAMTEFDCKNGVADVVVGTYRPYLSVRSERTPIDVNWVSSLLSFKPGALLHIEEYCSSSGISMTTAKKQLKQFVDAKLIRPAGDNCYEVVKTYEKVVDLTVSVEAKLKNWQKALAQAHRYKRFANMSFVLLDDEHTEPAVANLHLFKDADVGLMSMDDEGYHMHHIPDRRAEVHPYYHLRLNEAAYSYFLANYAAC